MKVGDKVKLIKGNPFGKVGIIKQIIPMKKPVTITSNELKKAPLEENYGCEAEDGTIFSGWEDDLELLE
jgi:ribosomal protein L24